MIVALLNWAQKFLFLSAWHNRVRGFFDTSIQCDCSKLLESSRGFVDTGTQYSCYRMFIGFLLEPSIVVTVLEPSIGLSFAWAWILQPFLSFVLTGTIATFLFFCCLDGDRRDFYSSLVLTGTVATFNSFVVSK
jgi:hypothetical protein